MEQKRQEDLDMMSLIQSFKNGVRDFFMGIVWLIEFSFANIFKLAIFMVVFAGLSLAVYYMGKPYYKATLSVSHIRLNNEYCAWLVNNLNHAISDKNQNRELSALLDLKPEIAREVVSIHYKTLNDRLTKRYEDSVQVVIPFMIEVEVYNNDVLQPLQNSIMNYLESNKYASRRRHIDSIAFVNTEEMLTKELAENDSLKKVVKSSVISRSSGNGLIFGAPLDPTNVYKRSAEIFDKRMNVMRRRLLNNSFEVLVGFNRNENKASPGRIIHASIGLLVGYIIGLLFLFFRQRQRTVRP